MTRFMNTAGPGCYAPVTIVGAPYDRTVLCRPGCRQGPDRIREVSDVIEDFSFPLGRGYTPAELRDIGNLDIAGVEPEQAVADIARATRSIVAEGSRPLWLGGEHLISYGVVRGLVDRFPDLYVVVLDAHADVRDSYGGRELSHAGVSRSILELLGPGRLFQLGVRSGSREEWAYLARVGPEPVPVAESSVADVVRAVGHHPVYLSVDIDVFDPAFAPGTGSPEPCGPDATTVWNCIVNLFALEVVGADVVEVSPPLDHSDITSLLAARLVRDIAILLAPSH